MNAPMTRAPKKIPLEVTTLIQQIIRKKSTNILYDMDQLDKLLKTHNINFNNRRNDTPQNIMKYNTACLELICEKINSILPMVRLFKQPADDLTNYASVIQELIKRSKKTVVSLDIGIKDEEDLKQTVELYNYNFANYIAKYLYQYKHKLLKMQNLNVTHSYFNKPFKFNTQINTFKDLYANALKASGFSDCFFEVTLNEGYTIDKFIKSIHLLETQLYLRLISNNSCVFENFTQYCQFQKTSGVSLIHDLKLTPSCVKKQIFKPVTQTLNSKYANLTAAPELCETIQDTIKDLRAGYRIITKNTPDLSLIYNLDDLSKIDVRVLYKARARHLYTDLQQTGLESTLMRLRTSLKKAGVTAEYLKTTDRKLENMVRHRTKRA